MPHGTESSLRIERLSGLEFKEKGRPWPQDKLAMNYLFFDIECANPKFNSVCTFGYVLTDGDFRELKREDILMNPETSYDRYVIRHILHYSEEELNSRMPFPCFYDGLRALMCGKDTVVLGFSISNDIRFLNETCIRYRLPCLNYRFYDVQKIYGEYIENTGETSSIERAGEQMHLDGLGFVHRSDEDARVTMEILKAICREKKMTLAGMLEACPSASGTNCNFVEIWTNSKTINHKKNHFLRLAKRKKQAERKAEKMAGDKTAAVSKTEKAKSGENRALESEHRVRTSDLKECSNGL